MEYIYDESGLKIGFAFETRTLLIEFLMRDSIGSGNVTIGLYDGKPCYIGFHPNGLPEGVTDARKAKDHISDRISCAEQLNC